MIKYHQKAFSGLACFIFLLAVFSIKMANANDINYVAYHGGDGDYIAQQADIWPSDTSQPILFTVSQGLASEFDDLQLEAEKLGPRKKSKGDAVHKWLGISTLVFTAATVIVHPEGGGVVGKEDYETHERFANIATVLAVTTVASGLINYWGSEFDLSKGVFHRKNIHAYLGITGTLLMVLSVSEAPETEHIQPGQLGGMMMAAAYGLTFTF
ncbi:MAG: hypothetical protein K0U45_08250 [Alphaproteobacteria bacterium]|nr:hypothetical protein [Alphaproteobacteria bacterium]